MSRLIFSVALLLFFANTVNAQSTFREIGSGVAIQFGLNPKSDHISWVIENKEYNIFPKYRFNIGPTFQIKSYEKIQFEFSVQYGQSNFSGYYKDVTLIHDVKLVEWKLPLSLNYNVKSPIPFHSSLVYLAGLQGNYQLINPQGNIKEKKSVLAPSVFIGVRLASEIKSFGRFEYGVSFNRNLGNKFTFQVASDDALPSTVILNQKTGQFNLNFIYYITPRKYNWSFDRYKMDGIVD